MDRPCATETVDLGFIPGQVKPKTIKIGILSQGWSTRTRVPILVYSKRLTRLVVVHECPSTRYLHKKLVENSRVQCCNER